jgi:hypothetical protein
MRVLLDECVPRKLKRELPGHDVWTVQDKGWKGKKNGELLALMLAERFEVLLTLDKGLKHQQNIQAAGVAVVLLTANKNKVRDLLPLMPAVNSALGSIKPGDFVKVAPPPQPTP